MSSKIKKDWIKTFAFKNEQEIVEHISAVLSTSFAFEIEQLLKERGMTKKELAQKIGTSASYITQIMTGDKLVNMVFLAKIKHHLGVDFLFQIEQKRKSDCKITDFNKWDRERLGTKTIKLSGKGYEPKAS